MEADRLKWNQRFSNKPNRPPRAPGFLADVCPEMSPGTVLDLASGDGAAALYLAEKGFEVTAADISEVALGRLQVFADQRGLNIHTRVVDLDTPQQVQALGRFDNVVVFHFKPSQALWQLLPQLLVPGGQLVLSTFNMRHHRENGFSRRFCLAPEEWCNVHPALTLRYYRSVERDGDFMDDYLFVAG